MLSKGLIVGIGASAGGVKALQTLFQALTRRPERHLRGDHHPDPNRQSELSRILAGGTPMPVTQVSENLELEPSHVYVIAPNRRLVLTDHEIATAEFAEPRRVDAD